MLPSRAGEQAGKRLQNGYNLAGVSIEKILANSDKPKPVLNRT